MRAYAGNGGQVLDWTTFGRRVFQHRPSVPAGALVARKARRSFEVGSAFRTRHRDHRGELCQPSAISDARANDGRSWPANRLPQLSCERSRRPIRLVAFSPGAGRTQKRNCCVLDLPYDRWARAVPARSCTRRIGVAHQAYSIQARLKCTIDDSASWQYPTANQAPHRRGNFLCDLPQGTSR